MVHGCARLKGGAARRKGKIFGRLDCCSGVRMHKENRVFFLTWDDALANGYRPCKEVRTNTKRLNSVAE